MMSYRLCAVIVKSQLQSVHPSCATNSCMMSVQATMLLNALAWNDTQQCAMLKRIFMCRQSLQNWRRGGGSLVIPKHHQKGGIVQGGGILKGGGLLGGGAYSFFGISCVQFFPLA